MANRNKKKIVVWYEGVKWFIKNNKKVEPTNWKLQALIKGIGAK